jgi:hypothetical protein
MRIPVEGDALGVVDLEYDARQRDRRLSLSSADHGGEGEGEKCKAS